MTINTAKTPKKIETTAEFVARITKASKVKRNGIRRISSIKRRNRKS